MGNDKTFIGDLIPASVSQLSLISCGTDDHTTVLDMMFRHFVRYEAIHIVWS